MKLQSTTLWKLLSIAALAALCAYLFLRFSNPTNAPRGPAGLASRDDTANATATPSPFANLSALVDHHLESVFSPLESNVPMPTSELRAVRLRLASTAARSPAPAYQTALQLCDAFLLAIQERERTIASLANPQSKPHAAAMAADWKKDLNEKQRFFEQSIQRRWSENSNTYRAQVSTLRARLAEEERQLNLAPSSGTAPAGETIVLQRPTTVRLKYGSATLPAGQSLRVLNRTANGVIVDYSGEQVVVPLP